MLFGCAGGVRKWQRTFDRLHCRWVDSVSLASESAIGRGRKPALVEQGGKGGGRYCGGDDRGRQGGRGGILERVSNCNARTGRHTGGLPELEFPYAAIGTSSYEKLDVPAPRMLVRWGPRG